MTHFSGGLPAVGGIDGDGLGDDGSHVGIGADGSGHALAGTELLKPVGLLFGIGIGERAVIVDLIEDQTQGVGVHGGIQAGVGVGNLRRGIDAAAALGQGGIGQHIHGLEAQVTDAVFLIVEQIDVLRLQIHIEPSGLPAHRQGGAHVDAQVHGAQVGHAVAAQIALQGHAVAADEVHLVADALFHGHDLVILIRDEASLSRQGIQGLDFPGDALCQLLVIGADRVGILVNAGQQQRFDLNLGGGEGDLFHNISFFRIIPHGRIADNTMVVRNGLTQGEAVQHGGDVSGF